MYIPMGLNGEILLYPLSGLPCSCLKKGGAWVYMLIPKNKKIPRNILSETIRTVCVVVCHLN